MATYTTKKCPYCKRTYENYSTYTKAYKNHSGSPFITCPSCQNVFVDKEIKEPALIPYSESGFAIWRYFFNYLFPFGIMGGLCAYISSTDPDRLATIIAAVCLSIYFILTLIDIVNIPKYKEEFRAAYRESEKRLENPEYAIALQAHGFKVPEKYLKESYRYLSFDKR